MKPRKKNGSLPGLLRSLPVIIFLVTPLLIQGCIGQKPDKSSSDQSLVSSPPGLGSESPASLGSGASANAPFSPFVSVQVSGINDPLNASEAYALSDGDLNLLKEQGLIESKDSPQIAYLVKH